MEEIDLAKQDFWEVFGEKLALFMNLKTGSSVLDIGTGGGSCLIPAAKIIGPTGQAIGIDLWKNRIEEVRENIKENNLSNTTAQIMDARELTFEDNTFDFTVCGFIGFGDVFDFQNHKYRKENDKMKHNLRVLKPGGKAGFSTWETQGELDCLRDLLYDYLNKHTSATQDRIDNIMISYSKETKKGFKKILQDVGFNSIEIFTEEFLIKYSNFDEWFKVMMRSGWILREYLGRDENDYEDFKDKMLPHGIATYKQADGSYKFKKSVIFAFGTK
jgi:ubiquinone/menaquinone biosynthesis C-methylase UbiE